VFSALTLVPLADRTGPGLAWGVSGGLLGLLVLVFIAVGGVARVTVAGVTAAQDDDGRSARIPSGSIGEPEFSPAQTTREATP
jgi:hypothetical protein